MPVKVLHPNIEQAKGKCGGSAVIKGTRTPVWAIVGYYKVLGYSPEEIQRELPHLTLAQIHAALSYYYDHIEEVERDLKENLDEESWRKILREKGA